MMQRFAKGRPLPLQMARTLEALGAELATSPWARPFKQGKALPNSRDRAVRRRLIRKAQVGK
jgi:hypothetical protein